jgi:hypothetical protein
LIGVAKVGLPRYRGKRIISADAIEIADRSMSNSSSLKLAKAFADGQAGPPQLAGSLAFPDLG